MLDYLGVTENWSAIENIPWTQRWMFSDDATREPVSLDGVTFTGKIYIEGEPEPVNLAIQKSDVAEEANILIVSCIGLPEGRHPYEIYSVSESGNQNRLISGYIGVIKSIGKLVDDTRTYASRTLSIRIPGHVTRQIRLEWNSCTLASVAAEHALNAAKQAHADADTASQAATTATGAANAAAERAEEAEGYAGDAHASQVAAANSAASASTSAADAARDAKTASNAKAAVEGLAATWPQTVSNAEQTVSAAKEEAVTAIQTKQADSVLAVGRASQTAQKNIASVQNTAVAAVETAHMEAVGAVQAVQTTAESSIAGMVKEATDASIAAQAAKGNAEAAAERAGTSATNAANSAAVAQQALAAIPQVDGGGNMTLAGGLTVTGAVNANGGVNIPLAVGAQTDTSAVNRLYAAGMAGVAGIYTLPTYLDTGSITATGSARTTVIIPGHYAETVVPANTHSTVVHGFRGPNGQWNYSSFAGFSIPWQLTAAGKITIGIGGGAKTIRRDLTLESYSVIPGNDLAYNNGEILDITFDAIRDTTRNGYAVRVREIYALAPPRKWEVKTSTSFVLASHNEPIPYNINKIIYQQRLPRPYGMSDYGEPCGALFLLTGGGSKQSLWRIATVRGVVAFETGMGWSSIVTDIPGIPGGGSVVRVGAAERTNYQPGNINPVYYALESIASNAIETESTADFVDINNPID